MIQPRSSAQANEPELPQRLLLVGYVAMTGRGLALPCYGASRLPNQWYVASCTPPGDPEGRVGHFEPTELSDVRVLDDSLMREVGLGDPWVEVFLWDGAPHVGSRNQLWSELQPILGEIVAEAPLSGLDLAFGADVKARRRMAAAGAEYLTEAYGAKHARAWRRQVARTRFLSRLQLIGMPPRLGFLEVTGAGTLTLDNDAWSVLPDSERDTILRAARATAQELGLRLRTPSSLRRKELRPFEAVRAVASGRWSPESELPSGRPYDAVGLSILIITTGRRAAEIGRAAKPLEWVPEWSDSAAPTGHPIVREDEPQHSWLPWVEIRGDSDRPSAEGYGVVVALVDDELLKDAAVRAQLTLKAAKLASRNGVVLLAPALPELVPLQCLDLFGEDFAAGADLVLDTSLARSPLWGGAERRSLERRVADLILTAAQACLPGSAIPLILAGRRKEMTAARWGSLALWNPDRHSDAYDGLAAFYSESSVPEPDGVWLDEYVPLRGVRRRAPAARLRVGPLARNFEKYAAAVLTHYEQRAVPRGELWPTPFRAPQELTRHLSHPMAAAAFNVLGPAADSCALTAEAPTLRALQAAGKMGWILARVTDGPGLARQLRSRSRQPLLPSDIRIPQLHRFSENRRLATRGVDPRDIVRVPDEVELRAELEKHLALLSESRVYLPAGGERQVEGEIALPLTLVEAEAAEGNEFAQLMLSRYRLRGRPGRRLADLAVLWKPPEERRYLVEDGLVPLRVREIDGATAVPAQTFYAVEGDEGVPLLLGSSLFGVWARLTRSRSGAWTERFAVTRTFETFPILPPFRSEPSSTGALALWVDDVGELNDLAREMAADRGLHGGEPSDREELRKLRRHANTLLLKIYGLPRDAGEYAIAKRLIDLNRSMDRA